jgi:hypothetical protein
MKKLTRAQLEALIVIARMGDVSQEPRRRKGLRVGSRTLDVLLRLGMIEGAELLCGDGSHGSGSRFALVLTDAGRAELTSSYERLRHLAERSK